MESILMLGGSQQQVVAIEAAKRLGYRTVLCDYLPDNPGQYVADIFYQESTTDKDKILEIAAKENVSGILAYASDPAAPTAAYVAEKLGLPTNPLDAVETLSVKHKFRKALKASGAPTPGNAVLTKDMSLNDIKLALGELKFPIVIKPTDSSGSKGVTFLDAIDGVEEAIESASEFSRNGILIAEEYITYGWPYVIGGDVFVEDGIVKFWGCMSCIRSEEAPLVPQGKMYPSGLSDEQMQSVKRATQMLVDEVGIRFGELNIEIIVDNDNNAHYLELGARAGGNMIPIQLSDVSGINLVEANVLAAMGKPVPNIEFDGTSTPNGCFATYVLHSDKTGILDKVIIDDDIMPHVYRTVMYKQHGDEVYKFENAAHAIGILFLSFESLEQMIGCLKNIEENVFVAFL